jgi:hypothetical protein
MNTLDDANLRLKPINAKNSSLCALIGTRIRSDSFLAYCNLWLNISQDSPTQRLLHKCNRIPSPVSTISSCHLCVNTRYSTLISRGLANMRTINGVTHQRERGGDKRLATLGHVVTRFPFQLYTHRVLGASAGYLVDISTLSACK